MHGEVLGSLKFQHVEPYTFMDNQDEVISTLIAWNKLHLHQAFDTPFATKEMQNYIANFGTGKVSKEILDGKFDPNIQENLPAVNNLINNHLYRVAAADFIDITLAVKELKQLFWKQNKATSSSSSGHHYGHYK
eukprot:4373783-Ditylum_brightwellii.AAC.1